MNNLQSQLEHRTIRQFKQEPIPETLFDQLMAVARQTATSNGMQQYSIIRVTDPELKQSIAEICHQKYVARAPELLIFIADQHRNAQIAKEKAGSVFYASDMDRFFQGVTDACLAAQNVVNAAERIGLGAMFLGSILNDAEKLCELLKLPPLTFPVVGLGLGYPNQSPQLKPRMANTLKIFENSYQSFDSYLTEIADYDEEMQTYYDLRNANKRVDSFSDQVVAKLQAVIDKRQDIMAIAKKQGFTD
ncbi:NADPH-dependent oxidoreductase [Fusibacter paucivorans]|uniref:NADPH-dependent oxidoreductase n=1 Tax=Fusibacter paucivorans TaxID=76009 RepID=A0ABS5PPI7_9FIRM|nr:NADPH-dependent oxidoreductase [Fusibacter paucivorans]MBS7526309.1 NADPH-dependent oxidoreductase [Fusibacter paucivorans]